MDTAAHCAALVRDRDRDRYICDLFAPSHIRQQLFALHAFDIEISRVRDLVSDPMLGEIRLQWWQDALDGSGGEHPVAIAIIAAITAAGLPNEAFKRILTARLFDLYDDPMPDMATLEGYAGDTSSAIFQFATLMLAEGRPVGSATAAGHAGVAVTIVRTLRLLAASPPRGQTFVPADVLERHRVDRSAISRGEATPGLRPAIAELRMVARKHLALALNAARELPRQQQTAFLPLALVGPALDRMDRAGHHPLDPVGEIAPWRRQLLVWRAARRA